MVAFYLQNPKKMVRKIGLFIILTIAVSNVTAQKVNGTCIDTIGLIQYESMPIFRGNILDFIETNIIYPPSALNDSIEGKIFVSFYVDTLGNTINHKIVNEIRNDLNEEALRVTRLIKFDKPAMLNGKPTEVKYILPVEFRLSTIKKNYKTQKSRHM